MGVMCTHLDDRGSKSRYESVKLIKGVMEGYTSSKKKESEGEGRGGIPVVVGGDFNSKKNDRAYKRMVSDSDGGGEEGQTVLSSEKTDDAGKIRDVKVEVTHERRKESLWGNEITYTGFGNDNENKAEIDFVFVKDSQMTEESGEKDGGGGGGKWKVEGYAVAPNKFDDGVYVSDHRAVIADLVLT